MLEPDIQLFAEGDAGSDDGGNNAQEGGNTPKTYTQEELDSIVSERTGRATKSALKSFFSQKGLSEEEAQQAMNEYLENKKKNTPDLAEVQSTLAAERRARLSAELNSAAQLEAIRQGVDLKSVTYVLKMAELQGCADDDGKINPEKLTEAVKAVLDAVPALKGDSGTERGIRRIGGDGETGGQAKTAEAEVPKKKWNRFNL